MLRMHFFNPAHSLLACLVTTFDADDDLVTGDLSLNAHVNLTWLACHQIS